MILHMYNYYCSILCAQPKHDLPQYVGLDLRVEGLAISPQKGGRRSRIPVPSCAGHMATPTVVDINKSLVLSRTQ